MQRLFASLVLLVAACTSRPEPTVYIAPTTANNVAIEPSHVRTALRAFSVASEISSEVRLWSVGGAILVGVSPDSLPDRWLFAVAQADGLRPLPDLSYEAGNRQLVV